jgi:hypothetical protein
MVTCVINNFIVKFIGYMLVNALNQAYVYKHFQSLSFYVFYALKVKKNLIYNLFPCVDFIYIYTHVCIYFYLKESNN